MNPQYGKRKEKKKRGIILHFDLGTYKLGFSGNHD